MWAVFLLVSLSVFSTLEGTAVPEPQHEALGPGQVDGAFPLASGSGTPLPVYRNVTEEAGLGDFLHAGYLGPGNLEDPPPLFTEITGPGACWLDHDRDGWVDLYLVNTRYQSEPEKNQLHDPHSQLYRNNGDGTFTDVTGTTGARTQGILQGCAAADYTNNGYPDLFIAGWNGSRLLQNDGGVFTDVTGQAGLDDKTCGDHACWASSAVWFDADQDGCLDLYVTHFTDYDADDPPPDNGPGPGQYNRFYQNQCDGTFTDHTTQAGLHDEKSDSWSAIAADLDNDGWSDLYVSNDGDENDVYHNNGDGTFTRDEDNDANDPNSGMGTAAADFDRDGRHDLVTTNFMQQTNGIFQSFGEGYLDIGGDAPFDDADPYSGWGTNWFDMDNDGLLDLMVVNGITDDLGLVEPAQPVLAYRNQDATADFESVRGGIGDDIDSTWVARAAAWADYDNDGGLDFIMTEAGESGTHLFNGQGIGNRFLNVDLRSQEPAVNRDAIGARVTVSATAAGQQMQEKGAGSSYMSTHDPRLHFGLADADAATVRVDWPGGGSDTYTDVRANTYVQITKGGTLDTIRTLPLITLDGPEGPVQRLEPAVFHATVEPAPGRTIVDHDWDFGNGETRDGTATESHEYDDVGEFTVRVTVTDSAGDRRSGWTQVTIWDDLHAHIQMAQEVFGPGEVPHGAVFVGFSDGASVDRAQVDLVIRRTTGDPAVDEVIDALPFFAHELLGWVPVELFGTTDYTGSFRFQLPDNVVEPSPFLPDPIDHHPGTYRITATGGARGSVFESTETTFNVIVPAVPDE